MPRSIALTVAALGLAAAGLVYAVDDAILNVERVAGDGWTAQTIAIDWRLQGRAVATIGRMKLAAASQELRNVQIDCPRLELSARAIACERARVAGTWPVIGAQSFTARLVYGRSDGSLEVAAEGIQIGGGKVALTASLRGEAWTFDGSFVDVTLNNESGSLATDKLSARIKGTARQRGDDWQFDVSASSAQGQAYAQPIFLDFGAHALRASAAGTFRGGRDLTIERFTVDHAQVAQANGRVVLDLKHEQPLRSLTLQLASLEFPGAYESYLQPMLLDTNF